MNDESRGGIGLFSVLGLIFVTLKLTDTIDWSWWWVLAPFWMPTAVGVIVLIAVGVFVYFKEG